MSALAGIYNFTGIPADQKLISALGAALDPWGPDGGREACVGSVGMAYRAFHTSCESRMEIQPALSLSGHLLTWDGRLDNREEIISHLRDRLTEDRTDVALVMAAYQKWGAGFLERLIGDFALALWDSITQTLCLARDPFGTRTLYYHTNTERVFWSSTLDPILNLAGVRMEIDEEWNILLTISLIIFPIQGARIIKISIPSYRGTSSSFRMDIFGCIVTGALI
jgi:asparagine synthase (glutamine-hydrolysing)